jgi:hypothetical protein
VRYPMLNATQKAKLLSWGIKYDDLAKAIADEAEVDFALPDIKNYTDEDLTTRDANTKKEGIKEGKKIGIEIGTKALTDKFGLTDVPAEALKEPDKIFELLNTHFSKGDSALKEQIKLLQGEVITVKGEKDQALKDIKGATFDRDLLSMFPQNRAGLMTDAEYLQLVKMNLSFEDYEGVTVAKKGVDILRDPTTKNPLPVKDAVNTLFTEKKWVGEQQNNGGRGAGDTQNNSGGFKKLSQVMDAWEAEGKNSISSEFQTHLATIAKATNDFDMNS